MSVSTELAQRPQKKLLKFRRAEASLIGSPIVGGVMAMQLMADQGIVPALLLGVVTATVGNMLNFALGGQGGYTTKYAPLAVIPVVGAFVKPEKILAENAPYTFSKKNIIPTYEINDFLEENKSTERAWDNLFTEEVDSSPYSYVVRRIWVNDYIVSLGNKESVHAWYVYKMDLNGYRNHFSREYPGFLKDKMMYRAKLAKAKKNGEYIPIHWEKISIGF